MSIVVVGFLMMNRQDEFASFVEEMSGDRSNEQRKRLQDRYGMNSSLWERDGVMTMRFEREVKLYAEPVLPGLLKEESIYFFVHFVDDEMLIPTMEPVVFVGRNFEAGDDGRVYFQDLDSYREGTRYDTANDENEAKFQTGPEEDLGHVFEYEQALDVLIACSLRRGNSSHPEA